MLCNKRVCESFSKAEEKKLTLASRKCAAINVYQCFNELLEQVAARSIPQKHMFAKQKWRGI